MDAQILAEGQQPVHDRDPYPVGNGPEEVDDVVRGEAVDRRRERRRDVHLVEVHRHPPDDLRKIVGRELAKHPGVPGVLLQELPYAAPGTDGRAYFLQ